MKTLGRLRSRRKAQAIAKYLRRQGIKARYLAGPNPYLPKYWRIQVDTSVFGAAKMPTVEELWAKAQEEKNTREENGRRD